MEVVKGESKEENGRNDKKEVKNKILQIRMIMRKFRITAKWTKGGKLVAV